MRTHFEWPTRSTALAVVLGTLGVAVGLHAQTALEGGVFANHAAAGRTLWSGAVPSAPAYPMWGYSLLAGPLQARVIVVQIALLVGILAWWLPVLTRAAGSGAARGVRWLANPAVLIVLLTPWMLLAISYYSNSLGNLLAWIGAWGLLEVLRRRAATVWLVAAGISLGLAANVRTENLLLTALLAAGVMAHALLHREWRAAVVRPAAITVGALTAMVPWLGYTQQSLGTPRLTSTNGGGVMYQGLGVLRDNPWGVEADDEYVHEIAEARVGTHAWTASADRLFNEMFRDAVASHPAAFALRVAVGWRLALMQGVQLPSVTSLVRVSDEDLRLVDYLNERAKRALGLAVNWRQVSVYDAQGLANRLSFRHYAIIAAEYGMRGLFAAVFLLLLATSLVAVRRLGSRAGITWVWLAYLATWLIVAGFIQTQPRHTTMIIPVLVTTIVLGMASARPRHSGGKFPHPA